MNYAGLLSEALYQAKTKAARQALVVVKEDLFRGSALPICGRRMFFGKMLSALAERPLRECGSDPYSDYFLNEGSLIHHLLQRWLGLGGVLYGNWKCSGCGKTKGPCLGSNVCKSCGLPMDYEELRIEEDGFTCHLDAILYLAGHYILADFKTSKDPKNHKELVPQYFHQINSYFNLCLRSSIQKKYHIPKIDQALLIFVPRDYYCLDPRKWGFAHIKADRSVWEEDRAEYDCAKRAMAFPSKAAFKTLPRKPIDYCADDYSTCQYLELCHKDGGNRVIREYIKRWRRL